MVNINHNKTEGSSHSFFLGFWIGRVWFLEHLLYESTHFFALSSTPLSDEYNIDLHSQEHNSVNQ